MTKCLLILLHLVCIPILLLAVVYPCNLWHTRFPHATVNRNSTLNAPNVRMAPIVPPDESQFNSSILDFLGFESKRNSLYPLMPFVFLSKSLLTAVFASCIFILFLSFVFVCFELVVLNGIVAFFRYWLEIFCVLAWTYILARSPAPIFVSCYLPRLEFPSMSLSKYSNFNCNIRATKFRPARVNGLRFKLSNSPTIAAEFRARGTIPNRPLLSRGLSGPTLHRIGYWITTSLSTNRNRFQPRWYRL